MPPAPSARSHDCGRFRSLLEVFRSFLGGHCGNFTLFSNLNSPDHCDDDRDDEQNPNYPPHDLPLFTERLSQVEHEGILPLNGTLTFAENLLRCMSLRFLTDMNIDENHNQHHFKSRKYWGNVDSRRLLYAQVIENKKYRRCRSVSAP